MNRLLLLLLLTMFVCLSLGANAQAPQQFNYQGALRNVDGSPVANKSIGLRLSVLDGSASGIIQYVETRQVTTSALGLYNIAIGSAGALTSTNNFSSINWASGLKYLAVDVDLNGGSAFVATGASQLLSVPYALYAANAGSSGTAATGSAAGDLSGSYPAPTVVKIQGVNVSSVAPTVNQYLKFDGTSWTAVSINAADITGQDVTTTNSNIIALTNNTGAALKNLGISIKPGAANSMLVTAADSTVKWQTATDAKLVSGTLFNIIIGNLIDNTSQVQANTSAVAKITVAGAVSGNPVFVTVINDVLDFSVAGAWVSAANEVSIRFANYQPNPVTVTGKQYKILLIQ